MCSQLLQELSMILSKHISLCTYAFLILLCLIQRQALAHTCGYHGISQLERQIEVADVIFWGKVIAVKDRFIPHGTLSQDKSFYLVRFEIKERFKGGGFLDTEFQLFTEDDTPIRVGEEGLVVGRFRSRSELYSFSRKKERFWCAEPTFDNPHALKLAKAHKGASALELIISIYVGCSVLILVAGHRQRKWNSSLNS